MNGRTLQRGLLVCAALLLAFALYSRQDEPPAAPEVPASEPELPTRRVTRLPPAPEPAPGPSVASDAVDRAEAVLAEVMGGVRVNCPVPADTAPLDLQQSVQGTGDRFHLVQVGASVRGVVPPSMPSPDGMRIRAQHDTLVDCSSMLIGDPETRACHDEQLRANQGLPAYAANLVWDEGEPGARVPCRVEPMAEEPFRGRLTVADGRTPAEAGLELLSFGCVRVDLSDDGTFTGARHRGIPCGLLVKHPTRTVQPQAISLDTHAALNALDTEVEIGEPRPPQPPLDEDTIAMFERNVAETRAHRSPLVIALERTDLPDEVRAQLETWRALELRPTDDIQQQVDALRADREAER